MPRYNRKEDFELGLSQLIPFFDSLGFALTRGEPEVDRAGTSYSACFLRSPRSVELNHLYSLGPVIYSIREYSVEHFFYINALGASSIAQFPSFVDDSVSGYPALLHDLQHALSCFFIGPEEDFIAIAERYIQAQQQRDDDGRNRTYHAIGEDRLKARARELFRKGRYDEVVQIEAEIRYPEFVTESERKMFELARSRR